jgi:hypothetical protein
MSVVCPSLLLIVVVAGGVDLKLDAIQHHRRPSLHRALGMIFEQFRWRLVERKVVRERARPAEAIDVLLDVL